MLYLFLSYCTDENTFVLGTDEGLYSIELSSGYIVRVDSKRVYQVEVLFDEQLIIVVSGKLSTKQNII